MDELRIESAKQIQSLATQLIQVAQRLAGNRDLSPAQSPAEVLQKAKEGRCLYCGKVVDKAVEQYRRGLCVADYQKITAAIKAGEGDENEMIAKGWLLPRKKPGVQPADTRLEDYLAQKRSGQAKIEEAHSIVAAANHLTPNKPPATPPKKKRAKQ